MPVTELRTDFRGKKLRYEVNEPEESIMLRSNIKSSTVSAYSGDIGVG